MLITINEKIVKPRVGPKNKPLVSLWFKNWLIAVGFLFFSFFASTSFAEDSEELVIGFLVFFLFGLMIFALVVDI